MAYHHLQFLFYMNRNLILHGMIKLRLNRVHIYHVVNHYHINSLNPDDAFYRQNVNVVCLSDLVQFQEICLHFDWNLNGRPFK